MNERNCEDYANGAKRSAGWTFGHMFNFYFGNSTLVLVGEGPDGSNVSFSATDVWLEANHATNFGLSREMAQEFFNHVNYCKADQCAQAKEMVNAIYPFLAEGKLPGSAAIAIVSAVEGKGYRDRTVLSRENGFGEAIDEILPFIKWFTDDKDFWVWPE